MKSFSVIQVLGASIGFAFVGVLTGLAYQGGPTPLTVVAFRSVAVLIILAIYLRLVRVPLGLPPREAATAIFIGLILAGNNFALTAAIERIPVPLAVMLFYIWPALTSIGSWLIGQERLDLRTLVGLALGFIGVALALRVELTRAELVGVSFAIGAAFSWSATVLMMNHFVRTRDSRTYTFWMTITSSILFTAACLITRDVALPTGGTGWFGLVALPFVYAFALISFYAASASIGATRASFYMNFEPVAAVLLSAIILGQSLAPVQLAGAALVVVALFLFRPPHREPKREAASRT